MILKQFRSLCKAILSRLQMQKFKRVNKLFSFDDKKVD